MPSTTTEPVVIPDTARHTPFPAIAPDDFAFTFDVQPLASLLGCYPFLSKKGKPIYRRSLRKNRAFDVDTATRYILCNLPSLDRVPIEVRRCLRAVLRFENGVQLKEADGLHRVHHEHVDFYAVSQSSRKALLFLEAENDLWKCELAFGYGADCLTLLMHQDGCLKPLESTSVLVQNFEAKRDFDLKPGIWHMCTPTGQAIAQLIVLRRAYELCVHTPRKRQAEDALDDTETKRRRMSDNHDAEYTLYGNTELTQLHLSDGPRVIPDYTYPRFNSGDSLTLRPRRLAFTEGDDQEWFERTTETYTMRTIRRMGSFSTDPVHMEHELKGPAVFKMVRKSLSYGFADTLANARRFESEVAAMKRLSHPNIVKFIGQDARMLGIYMELAPGRDLARWRDEGGKFVGSEVDMLSISQNMTSALSYVHDQGISHNDVKAGNIVYDPQRGPTLIDFGHATNMGDVPAGGSSAYIPPETTKDYRVCSGERDVFAMGVLMLYLLGVIEVPEMVRSARYLIADALEDENSANAVQREVWMEQVDEYRRNELPRLGDVGRVVSRMLGKQNRPTASELCTLFGGLTLEDRHRPLLEYGPSESEINGN